MGRISNKTIYIIASVFLAAIALGVSVWMANMAPAYTEREREVRNENAALEKDITEIEAMGGTTEGIDERIREAEDRIDEKYSSRSVTDKDVYPLIYEIYAKAGVEDLGIMVGEGELLCPSSRYAPALYSVEVTLLFEGTKKKGTDVIRALENSLTADFAVTSFIYSDSPFSSEEEGDEDKEGQEANEGNEEAGKEESQPISGWVIVATLYYYG